MSRLRQHVTRAWPIWTLLGIALLAAADVWGPGIVNTRGGGDSPFLLQRTHQMAVSLRAGVFPVRWMPDAAYGLGYPFFNYYAALPYYLAAALNLLGLDLLTAIKLTQTLGFVGASLAAFGWVYHVWQHRAAAWLAAVAYTVAPFHLVNVYVRGDSLSEFYAFIFYPLILWALGGVVARATTSVKRRRAVLYLALAYAGLVLTHNVSALIFSPFALLYLLWLAWRLPRARRWGALALGGGGLALGLALSAWFWLPALLEGHYGQLETMTLGYFNYTNHFRASNLVQLDPLFDYSIAPTAGGPSPFAMGGPQALLAALGLLALTCPGVQCRGVMYAWRAGQTAPPLKRRVAVFVGVGLLLSTLMITPLSRPIWDALTLLQMVQFPWRFLSIQALFTATATAALVLHTRGHRAWGIAGAAAALLCALTLLPLQPERLLVGSQDVTVTQLQTYEVFSGNIGTTIRFEYLPREAVPRPYISEAVIAPDAPPRAMPLSGRLEAATQTASGPTARTWHIQTGSDGASLAFPLLYWPGWRAWVDGQETTVWAVESAGYLALTVPPGAHTVQLKLGRTPLRAGAEILSLVALLAGLGLALWRFQRPRLHLSGEVASSLLLLLVGVGVLASVESARITSFDKLRMMTYFHALGKNPETMSLDAPLDDRSMDFVSMPYLHHNPEGVLFADAGALAEDNEEAPIRLLGYTLSADTLAAGETLVATLHWAAQDWGKDAPTATLDLVSPAEHLQNVPYTLAESQAPLDASTMHALTLPENTPRGLYLLKLSLGEHTVYLRPVRVIQGSAIPGTDPEGEAQIPLLAFAGPDIRLHTAALAPQPGGATLHLEWSTARPIAANYAVSLRLLDADGNLRASPADTQPGYGLTPTSLWRPDERIVDRYTLPLPDDLAPGSENQLVIVFYTRPSLQEVARVSLPFALPLTSTLHFNPPERLFTLPALPQSLDIELSAAAGDHIRLAGYTHAIEGDTLTLTLWWVAQRRPRADYTTFVHLFDPATEDILVQHDAMPRQGRYPTSGWMAGEVVSDTIRLSLADVPPGDYQLAAGMYDLTTGERLPPRTPDGTPLPNRRVVLPETLEVPQE